jgi:hypothetical protein
VRDDQQMHVMGHHVSREEEIVAFPDFAKCLDKQMARPRCAQQRQPLVTTEGYKMQVLAPIEAFQALRHPKRNEQKGARATRPSISK